MSKSLDTSAVASTNERTRHGPLRGAVMKAKLLSFTVANGIQHNNRVLEDQRRLLEGYRAKHLGLLEAWNKYVQSKDKLQL